MRIYYCRKSVRNDKTVYSDVYLSPLHLRVCGVRDPVAVHVVEDEQGDYFGWLGKDDDHYSMIYPHWTLFNMCFAYGSAVEVERGKGRVVKLRITEADLSQ